MRFRATPICLVLLAALSLLLTAEVVDRIVAVVGPDAITERELDYAYESDVLGLMKADPVTGQPAQALTREQYLDHLIDHLVISQEVKRQGVTVDALEVERAIDRKRESLGLSEQDFTKALTAQGMTMDQYREMIRSQLINLRLISMEVRGEIEITEPEITAFYNQNPELFTTKDQIKLRHMMVNFIPGDTASEAKAMATMKAARAEIAAGKPFAEVAGRVSQAPTAEAGGDLGWFGADELMPEFQEQVRGLAAGQMSPVFVQGPGVHLLLLEDVKKGEVRPLAEVHDSIHDVLFQQEAMERYGLWLERIKARTHIENRLTPTEPPKP
jgi:peptidyl-prolyl cis-trans isomerase SurA